MAKTDWAAHCQAFIDGGEGPKSARDAYCAEHGINPNSFRRELNKFRAANPSPAQKADQKTDQTPTGTTKKPRSNKTNKNQGDSKSSKHKDKGRGSDHNIPDQKSGTTRARARVAKSDPNTQRENGTRCFAKGNTASLIHGGYAEKFFLNNDHQDWSKASMGDIFDLMKSRLMLMESIRTDLVRQTMLDYEKGRAHTKEVFEDGELINVPMTFEEAIAGAMLTGHKEQTKLFSDIMKAEQTQQSIQIQHHKLNPLSTGDATKEIASVLEKYEKDEITAIQAGLSLEAQGIKLPTTLRALIEKEVEHIEPKSDPNEGGITEERLAELKAESEAFMAKEDERVSENRAELQKLLSEMSDG